MTTNQKLQYTDDDIKYNYNYNPIRIIIIPLTYRKCNDAQVSSDIMKTLIGDMTGFYHII